MSIWCEGSSTRIYFATRTARCPKCGKIVEVTRQGHIKPHIESKLAAKAAK